MILAPQAPGVQPQRNVCDAVTEKIFRGTREVDGKNDYHHNCPSSLIEKELSIPIKDSFFLASFSSPFEAFHWYGGLRSFGLGNESK